MFCKWCGKKITNIGTPCPSCGRNQDALESGNGFWDLCSISPKASASTSEAAVVPAHEKELRNPKASKGKGPKKTAGHKRSKARFSLLQTAITCLLLVALLVVGSGMNKMDDCLSELNAIRSDLSDLNERVNGGFEEIEAYHAAMPDPVGDQPAEDAERSIDELLENNEVLLSQNNNLSIACHELETEPAYTVYIASGDILTEDNTKIYWQKSVDAGDTWQTISEDTFYLVTEQSEDSVYRILCLMDSDDSADRICNYALTEEPAVEAEPDDDEAASTTGEDPIGKLHIGNFK